MRARLAGQRGSALVVAIMVVTLMMALGLAAYGYVDSESRQASAERMRESSFNQDDGLLSAQTYLLSRGWPASATAAYPDCTWNGTTVVASGGSTDATKCPNATSMRNTYASKDFTTGVTWQTQIRDDGGANGTFFDATAAASQPSWDANGNYQVWVWARSDVRGKVRIVVQKVQVEPSKVVFPKNLLTAGSFHVTTGGPKPFLQLNGAALALRCPSASSAGCFTTTKPNQVQGPGTTTFNYGGTHQLDPVQLDYLRQTAIAQGTYYTSCPASPAGKLVFVESGTCSYTGNSNWNSPTAPGIFIIVNGSLTFRGNPSYYGMIYLYNAQNATCPGPFDAGGASYIQGSVLIDNQGCFEVGANTRVVYDPNATQSVSYYGNMALVRSSFRELNP